MTDAEIERALEKATPGPWRWEVSRRSKLVELSGGNSFGHSVMSFVRWGMSSAAPIFFFWRGRNVTDDPQRADALAVAVAGREHHAEWFADIDHPDARLIAMAPALARLALDRGKEIERLRAALNSIDALDPEWQGIENLSRDAAKGLILRMGEIARAAINGGNDAE